MKNLKSANQLALLLTHIRYACTEMIRTPVWLLTTLIFPSMFFWFFGVPNADTADKARLLMGSFSAYAVLGVVLFQFGVSISEERSRPWYDYLRALPAKPWVHILAKLITGLIFAGLSVGLVIATSFAFTPITLSTQIALQFFGALFVFAVPFGLLGICIGLLCNPKSALPVANLIHLPMSFAGGLWVPPNALPKVVQDISPYLPTRLYGEIVWKTLFQEALPTGSLTGLALYCFVFFAIVIWAWRKQEVSRFR